MSDGEVEVEAVSGYQVLPKEVVEEIGSIKVRIGLYQIAQSGG
jgi:small subunit ribosomal protein S5e